MPSLLLSPPPSYEQQWYLHAAANAVSGTMPTAKQSAATPTDGVTAITNRFSATKTKGTSQTSITKASSAVTTAQKNFFVTIFIVQSPLAAQTFGAGNWFISSSVSESNSNANFGWSCCVYVWRPTGGTLVGRIIDAANSGTAIGGALTATGETFRSNFVAGSNVTCAAGDILVIEFWEVSTQGMATSYTDTIFYDGTTETSTTSSATYFLAPNPVAMTGYVQGSELQTLQAVSRSAYY